jgi:predicted alpha/beta hydrolase family esterase
VKRVYIIHAWDESPKSCWIPWLKRELEARSIEVFAPVMPNPAKPDLETWVGALSELVANPNESAYFVGHSIGCQTVLRYLGRLNSEQVGGAVFVAPWTHLVGLGADSMQVAKHWIETPIDWSAAKQRCAKFTALFSDNDGWVPLSEERIFQDQLGAKTQVVDGAGHFDSIEQSDEILAGVLRMLETK